MSKSAGKLKYDLSLSTTSVYDASPLYINKSAELSIDGNAQLQYITIGATYAENNQIKLEPIPNGDMELGKAYLYVRNLGPANAAPLKIAFGIGLEETTERAPQVGEPKYADKNMISELGVGEYMFMPISISSGDGFQMRSGYIAGSTYWTGSGYNDIEYMLCMTNHNAGPTSFIQPTI